MRRVHDGGERGEQARWRLDDAGGTRLSCIVQACNQLVVRTAVRTEELWLEFGEVARRACEQRGAVAGVRLALSGSPGWSDSSLHSSDCCYTHTRPTANSNGARATLARLARSLAPTTSAPHPRNPRSHADRHAGLALEPQHALTSPSRAQPHRQRNLSPARLAPTEARSPRRPPPRLAQPCRSRG